MGLIKINKQLSNSFSTGGGGFHFESHVQASFLTLMLSGGYAPCLPSWPIKKIILQGKIEGFDTDDLIVFVENPTNNETRKLLGQIKHSIQITQGSIVFSEVIQAAWNDFNNPGNFTRNKDIIALITGPINKTDFDNVNWLLNQAKQTTDVDQFLRYINKVNFSPSKSAEKLKVFQYHLKLANNNIDVSNEELYSFLKHFFILGYDLGKEEGVILSLLHSHISQFKKDNTPQIWARIVDLVQTKNQYAATITHEDLPEDIKNTFKQVIYEHIPKVLTVNNAEITKTDWNKHQNSTDLALMNLIGAWNENNVKDIEVLNIIVKKDPIHWIPIIREILQIQDSHISLLNGIWEIKERKTLLEELGQRIFDNDIEEFKKIAVTVLTEKDPSFEHPLKDRYLLSFQDKSLRYSSILKKGVAEGLALLGNQPKALIHCSRGKVDSTIFLTIREIFNDADWKLWGSLNDLLPVLAEACPNEFLAAVERSLKLNPCPFDELFSQEGNGISGSNYMTGLLWALEALAWDEELFVRVCIILGELASRDPGGNWANRPANSLSTILLPWMPQTMASFDKQKVAIETLYKEQPKVTWDLLIKLLPNKQTTTSGTNKPRWRINNIGSWEKEITNEEYWNQISSIAEIAVSIASHDVTKLCLLINHLEDLPKSSFDKLLNILSSEKITNLPEEDRLDIWHNLISLTSKHKKYHDANWALKPHLLSPIEVVSQKLSPKNPINLYSHLFSDRDFDLYEETGNWEEEAKKLNERRKNAINEILQKGGLDSVINFSQTVNLPYIVGDSLGILGTSEFDSLLLPKYLTTLNKKYTQFINGYILNRHYNNGWTWIDNLSKTDWNSHEISQLLLNLPFTKETWNRVAKWLSNEESDYWSKINANPYQAETDLEIAIDKFLFYRRPPMAIECLSALLHRKQPLDKYKIVEALLMTASLQDSIDKINYYDIVELIKVLQEDPIFNEDLLFKVEWIYLQFLDHHHGAFPKLLETRLATDPDFFCEVIRILYRSNKEDDSNIVPTEESKLIAMKVWRLLHEWKTPPGTQKDGSFDDNLFCNWLNFVKKACTDSGHWEVAQINIGEVLIYSPQDKSGLWINKTIAEALNSDDAEDMRSGLRTGFFNSRGAHFVDPTGGPEKVLAEQFRDKASDVEYVGYFRLALTLRGLAERYDRDAERIIEDHAIGFC